MSYTTTNRIKLFTLISLLGLHLSCINENLPPCDIDPNPEPCEVRLSYDYPRKSKSTGFDPREVKSFQIFVFDEDNKYIETFVDDSPQINQEGYFSRVILEPGEYSFMVYGNFGNSYSTEPYYLQKGVTRLDEISYSFNNTVSGTITSHPEHLFFSSLSNVVITKSIDYYTLPLVRNTYVIHFTAEGLPESKDNYRFVITDTNGTYRFDNAFLPGSEVHYIQDSHHTQESLCEATLTCLRLAKDRHPRLRLFDKVSGDTLYDGDLMELLLKMEEQGLDIDFSKMYEFDIHLVFERDPVTGSLTLEIYINGWNVVEKEVVIDWR